MMKQSDSKTHGGMRLAQIGLGAIAIIISLIVLTYPGLSTISLGTFPFHSVLHSGNRKNYNRYFLQE